MVRQAVGPKHAGRRAGALGPRRETLRGTVHLKCVKNGRYHMSNNENKIRSAGRPTKIAPPRESKSNRISRHVDEKTVAKSRHGCRGGSNRWRKSRPNRPSQKKYHIASMPWEKTFHAIDKSGLTKSLPYRLIFYGSTVWTTLCAATKDCFASGSKMLSMVLLCVLLSTEVPFDVP